MSGSGDAAVALSEVPSIAGDLVGEESSAIAGFGGMRLLFRRISSGEIVSRPCLKTYLEMAEAKMTGLLGDLYMSLSTAVALLPVSSFFWIFANLIFLHGCSEYPLGRTEPFLTKWLIEYNHFRSQHRTLVQTSNASNGLISFLKLQLTPPK